MSTLPSFSPHPQALEVRGLYTTYRGGVRALRGINLTAEPGVYGLLGPNGAGKSTLLRTVATLQLADAGSVRFGATDAFTATQAYRQQLGYLPQHFGVYPAHSAVQLLHYFGKLRGMRNTAQRTARIAEVLEAVNLEAAATRAVSTYSGGMLRRFGFAAALLDHPQLLVVDEPTAGLDPEERVRCLELLQHLGRKAVVVLSTHLVEDIASICDRVGILVAGQLRIEGSTSSLLNQLKGKVWQLPPEVAAPQPDPRGGVVRLLSSTSQAGTATRCYAETAIPGATLVDPTLADLYALTVARAS